jgi:transposase
MDAPTRNGIDVPKWKCHRPLEPRGASIMKITTIGIDLAKSVFQVHGADERGHVGVREQLRRDQVAVFFANLPAGLVGMEACGSAHHWARKLRGFGHEVRLISPQFVKPYVKSNKNDVADAEAICEAVARPNMRFVPIKTVEQQAVSGHRVRQGFVKARTAQANQIRGLLAEFGLVLPQGITNVLRRVPQMIDGAADLPASMRQLIERLLENMKVLDLQVKELEAQIKAWHHGSELSRKLEKIPGIGPLAASALVASIGDARSFKNGRQVAAWLRLGPKQDSSGGKPKLLGMSKRGDTYLRTLLIHGARSAIVAAQRTGKLNVWLSGLLTRRHPNIAAVALANKNARTIWALLAHEREFRPDYMPQLATA